MSHGAIFANIMNRRLFLTPKSAIAQLVLGLVISLSILGTVEAGDENVKLSKGQHLYVPAYSHIYRGDRESPFFLTVTLSIRNVDPKRSISIVVADYYETQGKLLKKYVDEPITLAPMESIRYVVPETHKEGGSGANFIVEWRSEELANPPIAESIMIGTQGQQGISFTSRGRVILVEAEADE
tara:strand:- start:12243 stop:12791 length:549 start_codon:yes stop_codon:yes gene_type:complete